MLDLVTTLSGGFVLDAVAKVLQEIMSNSVFSAIIALSRLLCFANDETHCIECHGSRKRAGAIARIVGQILHERGECERRQRNWVPADGLLGEELGA